LAAFVAACKPHAARSLALSPTPAQPPPPPQQPQQPQQQPGRGQQPERGQCHKLLVVDFGSMGALGLLGDAPQLLQVLVGALDLLGPAWRAVLLTGGWAALEAACAATQLAPDTQRLHVHAGPLACHHLLLRCCDALLHHGGAGTTAAALAAGAPQLVCPLQFDQHYWVRLASCCHTPTPSVVRVCVCAGLHAR
jgi:UDP:flavonoid glycosyltransferase YjiC (YdhE family)